MNIETPSILMPDTDIWTYDGGAVKALDGAGKVGGHLILWGDADTPDATAWRDYFTPETDLGRFIKAGAVDLIFHHDLPVIGKGKDGKPIPNPLAGRELGEVKAKPDDVGLWVEGVLSLRDEYERNILEMVKAGKLSWSSGAVSHRVRREKQPNGSHQIKRWHVVESSLTPTPGEPRAAAVALKTLMEEATGNGSTTSVFFPAAPYTESSPRSGTGPVPFNDVLDDCLRAASALGLRAASYDRFGPTKRKAIELVRDTLTALLVIREPDAAPAVPAASAPAPEPADAPPEADAPTAPVVAEAEPEAPPSDVGDPEPDDSSRIDADAAAALAEFEALDVE